MSVRAECLQTNKFTLGRSFTQDFCHFTVRMKEGKKNMISESHLSRRR